MNYSANNTKFVAVFLGSNHLENAFDSVDQVIFKPIDLNLKKHGSDLLNIVVSDKSNRRFNSERIIQYLEINTISRCV